MKDPMNEHKIKYLIDRIEFLRRRLEEVESEARRREAMNEARKIEAMKNRMAELATHWHDAKEKLPPRGVLVWCQTFGGRCVAAFYDEGGVWWSENHARVHTQFWQFLPPKKEV